jgi:hypothetical protein
MSFLFAGTGVWCAARGWIQRDTVLNGSGAVNRATGKASSSLRASLGARAPALTPTAAIVDPHTYSTETSALRLLDADQVDSVGHELFVTSHSLHVDYVSLRLLLPSTC